MLSVSIAYKQTRLPQQQLNVTRGPPHGGFLHSGRWRSVAPIIPKPVHPMHPLVQDRHDADVSVRQPPPVHKMMLVPEVKAVDGELCRDRSRCDAVHLDFAERFKEIGDIAISLFNAPPVARVSVDLVKPQRCGLLDANGHVSPGSGRSPRQRSTGDSFHPAPRRRASAQP